MDSDEKRKAIFNHPRVVGRDIYLTPTEYAHLAERNTKLVLDQYGFLTPPTVGELSVIVVYPGDPVTMQDGRAWVNVGEKLYLLNIADHYIADIDMSLFFQDEP